MYIHIYVYIYIYIYMYTHTYPEEHIVRDGICCAISTGSLEASALSSN